jgi:hypothetical protein
VYYYNQLLAGMTVTDILFYKSTTQSSNSLTLKDLTMKLPRQTFLMSLFAVMLCISLFIASCGSDETPTNNNNNNTTSNKVFIPFKSNNYWIYNRTVIDTSGKSGATSVDSTYVIDSLQFVGRGAWRIVTSQPTTNDTTYYSRSTDGSLLEYVRYNVSTVVSAVPGLTVPPSFKLPEGWMNLLPASGSQQWVAFKDSVMNSTVKYNGSDLTGNFYYVVNGVLGGIDSVTVGTTKYGARKVTLTYNLRVFVPIIGGDAASFSTTQEVWLIENVGVYRRKISPSVITSLGPTQKTPGSDVVLSRFVLR